MSLGEKSAFVLSVSTMDEPFPAQYKLPRLFVECGLAAGEITALPDDQSHYLKHVLRHTDGAMIRVFNGQDGEWTATLRSSGKKQFSISIETQLRIQPRGLQETHLIFPPLKKDALDFLIEKSVELGVTHLHPVLTQKTVVRDIKPERLKKQIIEACEQCERQDIPALSPLAELEKFLRDWPREKTIYAALEREDAALLGRKDSVSAHAFLIGPEGGFSDIEKNNLKKLEFVEAVNLGPNILRAETAALCCLSFALTSRAPSP